MISKRIDHILPSQTVTITNKVAELEKCGKHVLKFNVGEPDFCTPKHICDAARQAIDDGFTKYTSVMGIEDLRRAICEKLERENHLSYTLDEVTIGAGAKQCIATVLMAICDPGDEVIIPYPCWVSYTELVKLAGGTPVLVPCKEDFSLDIEKIREAVTDRTKAIMINTPNNPTGAVYSREQLEELAEYVKEKNVYILSDEVYERFIYGDEKHYSIASYSEEIKNKTIIINSLSKTYAMTGWRIGYLAANHEIISAVNKLQSQIVSSVQSISQKAAIAALNGTQYPVEMMIQEFAMRRNYMLQRLNRMPGISCRDSKGAFYLLPCVKELLGKSYRGKRIETDVQFAEFLLEEAGIAVVPGSAFFADGHIRIAYTNSIDAIIKGMDLMEKSLYTLS